MMTSVAGLFSTLGSSYTFLVPVVLFQLFALLLIASLVKGNARPEETARSVFAYLVQTTGILFMTFGGLPALYAVLARQPLTNALYIALLFVFAFGGLAFLWSDAYVRRIDSASRQIPETIYFYTWKFIGFLTLFLATLTFLLRLVLTEETLQSSWWVLHAVLFFYGVIVSWCTKSPVKMPTFNSAPMIVKAAPLAAVGMMPKAGGFKPAPGKKKKR
jgi:hypothetical protein